MILDLREDTLVWAVWFVALADAPGGPASGDWMAVILRQKGEPWFLRYRFRYYLDLKAFDSEDEISEYELEGTDPTDLEFKTDHVSDQILARYGAGDRNKLVIRAGSREAIAELAKMPWCNIKIELEPVTKPA
jgi:hypothetical protein